MTEINSTFSDEINENKLFSYSSSYKEDNLTFPNRAK